MMRGESGGIFLRDDGNDQARLCMQSPFDGARPSLKSFPDVGKLLVCLHGPVYGMLIACLQLWLILFLDKAIRFFLDQAFRSTAARFLAGSRHEFILPLVIFLSPCEKDQRINLFFMPITVRPSKKYHLFSYLFW